MNLLLVMVGGALGTGGRYLLGGWLNAQAASGFPWGTLGVNLLGTLAIGAVFGLARQGAVPPGAILFLTVGVLGGFTTFSTFSYETLRLLAGGSPGASLLNNAAVQLAGGRLPGLRGRQAPRVAPAFMRSTRTSEYGALPVVLAGCPL